MIGSFERTILMSSIFLVLITYPTDAGNKSVSEKRNTSHQFIHEENVINQKSNMNIEKGFSKGKANPVPHSVPEKNSTRPKSDRGIKKGSTKESIASNTCQVDEEIRTPFPPKKITRTSAVRPAGANDFRHIVSIQEYKTWKHRGAGSIFFGRQWILTTRTVISEVGKVKLDDQPGGTQFIIKRAFGVVVLPKYSNKLSELDRKGPFVAAKTFCHPFLGEMNEEQEFTNIGLIKLGQKIESKGLGEKEGFETIELIKEDVDLSKQNLSIAGWGVYDNLQPETPLSDDLMTVDMPVMTNCSNPSKLYKPFAHICSFLENTNICIGDEGGPAMYTDGDLNRRHFLAGVMGFSDREKCRGNSIFLNVTYFRDFIDYVRRNEPSEYECQNLVNKTNPRPMTSKNLAKRPSKSQNSGKRKRR